MPDRAAVLAGRAVADQTTVQDRAGVPDLAAGNAALELLILAPVIVLLIGLVVAAGIFFLAILFGITLSDYWTRGWLGVPGS